MKNNWATLGIALLFWVSIAIGVAGGSTAGVQLNINIAPPPPVRIPSPPSLVVIPGTYVYAVPGIGPDLLFYRGYWYRPHGTHWFWAGSYNGPWQYLRPARIPGALLHLPPDYRRQVPGFRPVPYRQLTKDWARWEREQCWDQKNGRREGSGRHHVGWERKR
jgi:hypothetical protein